MTMALFGIDCASYQGDWDEAAEKAGGLSFGLEKASQGAGYANPFYPGSIAGMRTAGFVPGAYHFLDGTSSGVVQAEWFLHCAGGPDGKLLALDVESFKMSRVPVVGWFVEMGRLAPGRDFVCYTGQSFWSQITGDLDIRTVEDRIGARIWLWDAGDGHRPNRYQPGSGTVAHRFLDVTLAGWRPYGGWTADSRLFLQFTDSASEPGVAGGVDGDAFFGDLIRLRALAGIAMPPPQPRREPPMFVALHVGTPDQYLCWGGGKRPISDPAVAAQLLHALGQDAPAPLDAVALAMFPTPPAALDVTAFAHQVAAAVPTTVVDVQLLAEHLAAVLPTVDSAVIEAACTAALNTLRISAG